MLKVKGLSASYGSIQAVKGISLEVEQGEIVTVIGANGAGKTTTLRAIVGLHRPVEGEITFCGERIEKLSAAAIARKGIALVPEGRRIFPRLSVMDNLLLGAYQRNDPEVGKDLEEVFSLFPRLKERTRQQAGTLSGGEQQMLAVGRALMSRPKLLLLDEPSMGLAPILVMQIFETILEIHRRGTTVLLVEQNARMALEIADKAYVLETGRIVLSGSAREIAHNPEVIKAYLGE